MKIKTLLFLTLLFITRELSAQSNATLNAAEIIQALKKLNTIGSVLYIAAHPDDENTRLLTYLSKEKNIRTGYLSVTRGDGGQNLIGKEQSDLLGLIRTNELLAARNVDGAEQFFTRANDFGYSKNSEETLKFWNKDSILSDMVWGIRKFKPDVIICRFPTTGEGGHGHHTASAILAQEAFDAAGDPRKFPEQLKYVERWHAKRLFWNTYRFGSNNTTDSSQTQIDVGLYNTLLGKSYGEIAAESRSMHKSQGFGSAKTRGSNIEYFKLLKGDSIKKDLFDDIDLTWGRLYSTFKFNTLIEYCIEKFDPQHPEKIIPELIELYKQLQKLDDSGTTIKYWKSIKLKETQDLILACSGLWLEAGVSDYIGIPGKPIQINPQLIVRNNYKVKLNKISWLSKTDSTTSLTLNHNELYSFTHNEILSAQTAYSNPYWLNEKHDIGMFTVKDRMLIGTPKNISKSTITFFIEIDGVEFPIERELTYKNTDPVKGEVYRPFEILPPATVTPSEKIYVFSESKPRTVSFTIKANTANIAGKLSLRVPEGWTAVLKDENFKLENKGDESVIEATIVTATNSNGKIVASLVIDGKTYSKSITRIEYDHIPYQFILSNAEASLINIDVKKEGVNIGYIDGAGDEVAACLRQVGYNVTSLTDEQLTNADLSSYNAIIVGIRAYNTNERLQVHYSKLMEYVEKGGNLIVQYNTNSRMGPVQPKIGPYPFKITRDRVTDEIAEVRITNEKHSALTFPNIISKIDFDGWIQERGIYFASEVDKNYETIFSMNDAGEKPLDGSLIIGKYGKGNFVYTGLAFFRELPAGVPGSYRLFANLISLPQNKP